MASSAKWYRLAASLRANDARLVREQAGVEAQLALVVRVARRIGQLEAQLRALPFPLDAASMGYQRDGRGVPHA